MDLGCQRGDFNKFFHNKTIALLLVQRDVFGATASRLRQFLHKSVEGRFFAFRGSSCLLVTNSDATASVAPKTTRQTGSNGKSFFWKNLLKSPFWNPEIIKMQKQAYGLGVTALFQPFHLPFFYYFSTFRS